jgi:hypothetical protein
VVGGELDSVRHVMVGYPVYSRSRGSSLFKKKERQKWVVKIGWMNLFPLTLGICKIGHFESAVMSRVLLCTM